LHFAICSPILLDIGARSWDHKVIYAVIQMAA